ncbi:MAG TPA: hypothetical protein VND68_01385 [Chloroflexia bacterium]|jgi:DNA-binding XRE family transcriptional regulator|nr:hypothetical protein [Chloroflexia bacterium]
MATQKLENNLKAARKRQGLAQWGLVTKAGVSLDNIVTIVDVEKHNYCPGSEIRIYGR